MTENRKESSFGSCPLQPTATLEFASGECAPSWSHHDARDPCIPESMSIEADAAIAMSIRDFFLYSTNSTQVALLENSFYNALHLVTLPIRQSDVFSTEGISSATTQYSWRWTCSRFKYAINIYTIYNIFIYIIIGIVDSPYPPGR